MAELCLRLLGSPAEPSSALTQREIIKLPPRQKTLSRDDILAYEAQLQARVQRGAPARDGFDDIFQQAALGLNEIAQSGADAALSPAQEAALEALLIASNSRPCIPTKDLDAAFETALPSYFQTLLETPAHIRNLGRSIGQIGLSGRLIGTGFVAAQGLIMTAAHVAAAITDQEGAINPDAFIVFEDGTEFRFSSDPDLTICQDFCADHTSFSQMDCAVLRLASDCTAPCPPALTLSDEASGAISGLDIITIAYPGKPRSGSERFSVLERLFDFEFGIQRVAIGEVTAPVGALADDARRWVFSHDCTTLGGCSGAPIIDVTEDSPVVIGVHFAGNRRVANYAHATGSVRDEFEELDLNYA